MHRLVHHCARIYIVHSAQAALNYLRSYGTVVRVNGEHAHNQIPERIYDVIEARVFIHLLDSVAGFAYRTGNGY